ncbi:MAG TPA: hypothetical protein DDW52_28225 [Planctomycetaceae bacterium]|nr:hypothetical protein [Planctomycetaceae bacterium]
MEMLKKLGGILLMILAAAKLIGVIVLLSHGETDRTGWWLTKQVVYAITFAVVGAGLLLSESKPRD